MAIISFVGICFLFVFLIRDAQLLSTGPLDSFRWRLGSYWTVLSCCVLAARGLNVTSADEIIAALRSPLVWWASVGLHVAGLAICLWLRARRSDHAWLLALFPTPMLALLLLGVAAELDRGFVSGMPLRSCLLVALGWTVIVGIAGKLSVLHVGSDPDFAVSFAAASNSMAFALFPLSPFF